MPPPYPSLATDFDGVLVDSVPLKSEAFVTVLGVSGAEADAVRAYHHSLGGINRRPKLKHCWERILQRGELSETALDRLCHDFSEVVCRQVIECPEIAGATAFLEACRKKARPLYVISGTTQGELEQIIQARGWTPYFAGIYGYPAEKAPTLRQLKASAPGPICYLGDALSDADAAEAAGVDFFAVNMDNPAPHIRAFRNPQELLTSGKLGLPRPG
ncbi:MAG: hypothetical protein RL095_558 [Verrucomicrobiota bacterium]|jgi:phosphoglycolate phosphatase-like HAD superfamily hydrolase